MNKISRYLLSEIRASLDEELYNQEKLINYLYQKIGSVKDAGIVSVTASNKTDLGVVVRFEDKDSLTKGVKKIKTAIKNSDLSLSDDHIPKFYSSADVTTVEYKDGSGKAYIVYKTELGIRDGLALEQIIRFLLSGQIDDQLKNRIDLSPNSSKDDVISKLKNEFLEVFKVALVGKKKIIKSVGKIKKVESVGSQNSKADLVLYSEDGKKIGLSIKLVTEEGRGVRFTYNKNLGYGDEKDDNLVRNPSGEPWWVVGRQIFAKKVGKRKYVPKGEGVECPAWMTKAKEDHPDLYKEAMEEVYAKIREVLIHNLKRLRLKDLVDMVNEAHLGVADERKEYDKFLKLTSTSEGVKLISQEEAKPNINKLKMMNKNDIIRSEGANIIIDIPGLEPLTIHSVKFHSNMLSDKRDDLKIKTR
jgi:hypothetical protein